MRNACRVLILCCLLAAPCRLRANPEDVDRPDGGTPYPDWPFFAFCMDSHDAKKRTLPQQASMLKELGYAGCGHLWPGQADRRAETLSSLDLRLFQVYVRVNLAKPQPLDEKQVTSILPALKPHGSQLALLVSGGKPSDRKLDDKAVTVIKRVADMARAQNVKVVLYPHTGDWLETTADAVRLAMQVNRPAEVGVMFNLCHWMKADPNRDLLAVLKEAEPWLMAVSLSGSATAQDVRAGRGNWIQPLGQGSYDIAEFLDALRAVHYTGPVGLQCWGIRGDARTHLKQSIETWETGVPKESTIMTVSGWVRMIMAGLLVGCTVGLSYVRAQGKARPGPLFETEVLFDKVRIPKITVAADGTVLAFAKGCSLLRSSTDGGKTWREVETLEGAGGGVIVDENSGDTMIVCPGKSFLLRSRDHGKSWKKEDIVVKPNLAGYGAPDHVPANVNASESGIMLKYGKHKGRLLIPARLQPPKGNNDQEYWPFNCNTAIYSDDGGKTWQTSYPVQSGTEEGTLAELSDGRIYYNSRCHMAVDHRRRIAWSHDGGNMWTDWEVSMDLFEVGQPFYFKYGSKPSYGCNAGLVRMPDEVTGGKDVLLFSTLDNPGGHRFKITVWASFDGAKTWPVKRMVYEGPSAYSSLTADKLGTIFLLFENGEKKLYERISVARFDLEWLTRRSDWRELLSD